MQKAPVSRSVRVLRPYQISLCTVLYWTFITQEALSETLKTSFIPLQPGFKLHLTRLLLREISDVTRPLSFEDLWAAIAQEPFEHEPGSKRWMEFVKAESGKLNTADEMHRFFEAMESMVPFKDEDRETAPVYPFARRSLFGLFARQTYLSFCKLSVDGVAVLVQDYMSWYKGSLSVKEALSDDRVEEGIRVGTIFKINAGKQSYVRKDPLERFQEGILTGNEIKAEENLRAYFEQHFHSGLDSGYRQHALFQLSRVHFMRDEVVESRRLLNEAIALCRVKGDRTTLMHCMSLLNRLTPLEFRQKMPINHVQPHLPPLEVLHDVAKLLDDNNNQPIALSFRKMSEAMGLYDHYTEVQGHVLDETQQWAQHAVQAVVWNAAGRDRLSGIEWDIVLANTVSGSNDDNRLHAVLWKAYQIARQGRCTEALAILLDPQVWRGIQYSQYLLWAAEVWHVLALRASRRGMHRVFHEVLLHLKPASASARSYWFGPWTHRPPGEVTGTLFEVLHFRKVNQSHTAVDKLLVGLYKAELQGRYDLYRIGMMLLADVGMEFGMSKKCLRIMEEIMPQINACEDVEQRGFAYFMMARSLIVSHEGSYEGITRALEYALKAEAEYAKLEAITPLSHLQYLISVLYDNLSKDPERKTEALDKRDQTARRLQETEEKIKSIAKQPVDQITSDAWRLVQKIGTALALRA